MNRVSILRLPRSDSPCPRADCVYNKDGICDDPSVNKRNGDASCHRMANKDVLSMLKGSPSLD